MHEKWVENDATERASWNNDRVWNMTERWKINEMDETLSDITKQEIAWRRTKKKEEEK